MTARSWLITLMWNALLVGVICIGLVAWSAASRIAHDEVVFRFVALFPDGLEDTERGKRGIDIPATVWIDGNAIGKAPYEIGIQELLRIGTPVPGNEVWPMADHGGHAGGVHQGEGWSYGGRIRQRCRRRSGSHRSPGYEPARPLLPWLATHRDRVRMWIPVRDRRRLPRGRGGRTGNVATYAYDNSNDKHSLGSFVGGVRNFQYWYRNEHAGGCTWNLSNALAIAIEP